MRRTADDRQSRQCGERRCSERRCGERLCGDDRDSVRRGYYSRVGQRMRSPERSAERSAERTRTPARTAVRRPAADRYADRYTGRDGKIRGMSTLAGNIRSGNVLGGKKTGGKNRSGEYRDIEKNRKNAKMTRRYPGLLKIACVALVCALLLGVGAGAAGMVMRMSYPRRYERLVRENCARFGVDESLVYAVIRTESGFDPMAKSSVGAMGLMQIMPDTFKWLQSKLPGGEPSGAALSDSRLYEPEINIRYGVYFLSMLRDEFGSDTLAAAAYHAGSGRVRQWLGSGQLSMTSKYEDIPSDTTGHYVRKVEKARDIYSKLYYDQQEEHINGRD